MGKILQSFRKKDFILFPHMFGEKCGQELQLVFRDFSGGLTTVHVFPPGLNKLADRPHNKYVLLNQFRHKFSVCFMDSLFFTMAEKDIFLFCMVASIDIAYVVRDTAADHLGLTGPARIIGMRSQGEAEIAIEQGETRYEGVTWTTRRQIAANRLIPLPEPARRGLINLADEVIATTNRAVAAAAQVGPSNLTRSTGSDRATNRGRSFESLQITRAQNPAPKGPRR